MTDIQREVITTVDAPKAIGPYSQALRVGTLIFAAGQLPLHPNTTELVEGGIEAETRRVLDNLSAVLAAAGASLANVVKTTVFMQDLGEFASMNTAYAEYFPEKPPARTTVEVARLPAFSYMICTV